MSRARAQSSTPAISAPDSDTNATRPAAAPPTAMLAFRPMPGASNPELLAPRMRSRYGLAASSIAWRMLRPRESRAVATPALITMAARVPSSPRVRTMPGIVAGGVQMMARSGACGRRATSCQTCRPSSVSYFGLTGNSGPLKPPSRRLRRIVAPTLPGRSDAPTRATDFGANSCLRLRTLIHALPAVQAIRDGLATLVRHLNNRNHRS